MCVKDTGTKYQLWISDFNIDGTFTRVHPFIISHTKTMTRTREDGKEEVFSACIKPDDTRYLERYLETKSVGSDIHEGSDINYINMKRYSGLHDKLCTIENIEVADDNARKNKNKKYGINILKIEKKILNLKYNILWLKINLKMILLELYAV